MIGKTVTSMCEVEQGEGAKLPEVQSSLGETVELPQFRPRAPWLSSDLQTMRNYFVRPFGGVRLYLEMRDGSGDRLAATLNQITGCETSSHMIITSRYLHGLGYAVLRLNLRGAGPSRETCCGHLPAMTADALSAIDGSDSCLPTIRLAAACCLSSCPTTVYPLDIR